MKTVLLSPTARRGFHELPADVAQRIMAKLQRYASTGAGDVKSLSGSPLLRLRVGDYRVLFAEDAERIAVSRIGHRSTIY